ncbi:MAG: class I SAM-dependent methyltransferase [Actinomycetota bacterium]
MTAARYTYGDSEFAADRLDVIARMFEPSSRALLQRVGPRGPALAIDLGCGPGNTTKLLADVLRPQRTVGLDRASVFLERARRDAPPGMDFLAHDVSQTPFPVGPADVLSCRLLLAHLADREGVIARWITQLDPGGVLVIDEIEAIETDEPAFIEYRALAMGVVDRAGGRLFAGPELAAMPDPAGAGRIADDVVTLAISPVDPATVFSMNLSVLVDAGEIEPRPALAEALGAIAGGGASGAIVWRQRQLAFRRTER